MNEFLVKQIVDGLFSAQHREMNILEWKFELGVLTVKAEDMEDGLVAIYTIQHNFKGFAASLEKGNFNVESD